MLRQHCVVSCLMDMSCQTKQVEGPSALNGLNKKTESGGMSVNNTLEILLNESALYNPALYYRDVAAKCSN